MTHLEQFLDLWLPATATGTYRALARWSGGYGVRNVIDFLPVTDSQEVDAEEISQYVAKHQEVFVYMATFSRKSTKADFAEPVPLLWLDFDEADPRGVDYDAGGNKIADSQGDIELFPSLIWETSEGHYQALWRLTQAPASDERKEMNRAIYEMHKEAGADPSYDVSRRLRIPGSINNKPGRNQWIITVTNQSGLVYDPIELPRSRGIVVDKPLPPKLDEGEYLALTLNLPEDVITLLNESPPVGQRSDVLMKLLLRLAGTPLSEEEIFLIAQGAGSNKFRGRPEQLWIEVQKAVALAERPPPGFSVDAPALPVTRTEPGEQGQPPDPLAGWRRRSELPEDYQIKWQYNPFLPKRSILLVTGMPGSRKSWTTTDLAVCIALGVPFMGVPPQDPGPVMYYAPDDEQERLSERVHLIEKKHGKKIEEDHFYWRQTGIHFMDRQWAVKMEAAIIAIKPKIVVFDGLYLMGYNPQDWGASLPQRLVPLKEMCSEHDLNFVLVHHSTRSRKEDLDDPRVAGMGSLLLGAFMTIAWTFEHVGMEGDRQKINWKIGGKAVPGRPNYRLSFGSDLTKYDVQCEKGNWGKEEEDANTPKQAEF